MVVTKVRDCVKAEPSATLEVLRRNKSKTRPISPRPTLRKPRWNCGDVAITAVRSLRGCSGVMPGGTNMTETVHCSDGRY